MLHTRQPALRENDALKRRIWGRQWLIAAEMGISPSRFSAILRYQLTDEGRQKIEDAIERVRQREEGSYR